MKIIEGFKMRTVAGVSVVIGEGSRHIDYNKIIALNESAAMLWQAVENKEFCNNDLAKLLVENYEIDETQALADATELSKNWMEAGLLEA